MKKLKLFVWTFVMILLQAVSANYIRIYDVAPVFFIPFTAGVMLFEDKFAYIAVMAIAGSVCTAVFAGGDFFFTCILMLALLLVFSSLRDYPRYMPGIWKLLIWTVIMSFVWETVTCVLFCKNIGGLQKALSYKTLIFAAYNALTACVIYPLLKKTLYNIDEKRRLDRYYVKH